MNIITCFITICWPQLLITNQKDDEWVSTTMELQKKECGKLFLDKSFHLNLWLVKGGIPSATWEFSLLLFDVESS